GRLLLRSRRPELSQPRWQTVGRWERPVLVSAGWKHRKALGDYFQLEPSREAPPALLEGARGPSFSELGLHPALLPGLSRLGAGRPTAVQRLALPALLRGRSALCAAETGSGKTLAYLVPLLHRLLRRPGEEDEEEKAKAARPRGLVVLPSRELLAQAGARLRWVVLDEADALMDDESFAAPLEEILAHAPLAAGAPGPAGPAEERTQVVVVGATFPAGLSEALGRFTDVGRFVLLGTQSLHRLPSHVQQKFMRLKGQDKLPELLRLLKECPASAGAVLVFCNTASTVNWLGYILDDHKIKHLRLQGQMAAAARAGIFASFQKGDVPVLVCTDLASRGLDTSSVRLVVNYDFPATLQDYLHRVGRVGRVGSKVPGSVVSFVTHRWDVDLVRKIETAARKKTGLPGMDSSINEPPPKGG
ncbi:DDX28 helicase, partial [Piaya cayana]|nr:DDX28 helicase [Piaya cayana]